MAKTIPGEIKLAARQELAKRNYADYLTYVYRGLYTHAQHTRYICQKLEGVLHEGSKRIMIFLPPRHGKSYTVTESLPSYFLLKNPEKRVMSAAYGNDLAQSFGRSNRWKVEEFGRELFDLTISREKSSMTMWEIDGHRGGMKSTTINGGATGGGADLLIIDDPIKNALEADSLTYRDRVYKEYRQTFRTRLHAGGSIILIQTRWHEDDLAGRLLAESGEQWDVISLPAICDAKDDLLGRQLGAPLWPEHGYDEEWSIATKREVGSRAWEAMYQQSPTTPEGNMFKREWWKYYKSRIATLEGFDEVLQSWDCTFKDTETSDFVVGQVWGKKGANRYLVDQVRGQMGFTATLEAIRQLSYKWPDAHRKLIEDKANGSAVIDVLHTEFTGIIAVNPEGGKIVRAQAVSPAVESGNVYLPDPSVASWIGDFVEEFAAFPTGKHDDQVDAMTQANAYFSKNRNDWGVTA